MAINIELLYEFVLLGILLRLLATLIRDRFSYCGSHIAGPTLDVGLPVIKEMEHEGIITTSNIGGCWTGCFGAAATTGIATVISLGFVAWKKYYQYKKTLKDLEDELQKLRKDNECVVADYMDLQEDFKTKVKESNAAANEMNRKILALVVKEENLETENECLQGRLLDALNSKEDMQRILEEKEHQIQDLLTKEEKMRKEKEIAEEKLENALCCVNDMEKLWKEAKDTKVEIEKRWQQEVQHKEEEIKRLRQQEDDLREELQKKEMDNKNLSVRVRELEILLNAQKELLKEKEKAEKYARERQQKQEEVLRMQDKRILTTLLHGIAQRNVELELIAREEHEGTETEGEKQNEKRDCLTKQWSDLTCMAEDIMYGHRPSEETAADANQNHDVEGQVQEAVSDEHDGVSDTQELGEGTDPGEESDTDESEEDENEDSEERSDSEESDEDESKGPEERSDSEESDENESEGSEEDCEELLIAKNARKWRRGKKGGKKKGQEKEAKNEAEVMIQLLIQKLEDLRAAKLSTYDDKFHIMGHVGKLRTLTGAERLAEMARVRKCCLPNLKENQKKLEKKPEEKKKARKHKPLFLSPPQPNKDNKMKKNATQDADYNNQAIYLPDFVLEKDRKKNKKNKKEARKDKPLAHQGMFPPDFPCGDLFLETKARETKAYSHSKKPHLKFDDLNKWQKMILKQRMDVILRSYDPYQVLQCPPWAKKHDVQLLYQNFIKEWIGKYGSFNFYDREGYTDVGNVLTRVTNSYIMLVTSMKEKREITNILQEIPFCSWSEAWGIMKKREGLLKNGSEPGHLAEQEKRMENSYRLTNDQFEQMLLHKNNPMMRKALEFLMYQAKLQKLALMPKDKECVPKESEPENSREDLN